MTIQVDGKMTVRDLVGRYPQTRPVFEKHGIDYCCGGGKCLIDVANEHGLKLAALKGALQAEPNTAQATDKNWYAVPLTELISYIVETHHGYTKTALLRLSSLVPTVLKAHGAHHRDVLRQVQDLFQALNAELSSHLLKEEQVLFPYIVAVEAHDREATPKPHAAFGSARNPIRQMEHEHENAGAALAKLREATNNYTFPRMPARPLGPCTRNCNAWRRTYTSTSTWKTTSSSRGQSNWKNVSTRTDSRGRSGSN